MSSRLHKRPSSARRHIKLETFSLFVSANRLRKVQALIRSSDAEVEKPDAILCIAGIDSRYHEGSSELIDHLLFGFFDRRKAELEESGFEEEVIDDLIILIRKHEVDVYCNPINYHYLLPYVSHWRNLRFHCLTDAEYEDEEAAEEFKIRSFISMVQGVKKIGIPHSITSHIQPFDYMVIEKWPIIQAYALEDYGGGGFFTLKFEVMDVGQQLGPVYSQMDPTLLEVLLTEQLTQFERQWSTMTSNVGITITASEDRITEDKVCEPLWSYYKHGKVGSQDTNSLSKQKKPYVLFGTNCKRIVLDDVRAGKKSVSCELQRCGINNQPAKFMICHGMSPRGPVCCTRTYFFTQTKGKGLTNDDANLPVIEEDQDSVMLVDLYAVMVHSVLEGIKKYSQTLSVHKARAAVVDLISEGCRSNPVLTKYLQRRSDIVFTLEAMDQDGSSEPLEEGTRSVLLKSANLHLYDVPSMLVPGKALGSLAFSEVFQDSVISVQKEDGTIQHDSQTLVITGNIPRFCGWSVSTIGQRHVDYETELTNLPSSGSLDLSNSLHSIKKYGQLLLPGQNVSVCTDRSISQPAAKVDLFAYEAALVLMFHKFGAVVVDSQDIQSLSFYDGNSSEAVSVLIIEVRSSGVIPAFLHSDDHLIFITFVPKSKAYKLMFQEVLPEWKIKNTVPAVQKLDQLPSSFIPFYNQQQKAHVNEVIPSSPYHRVEGNYPDLKKFITHFSYSSVTANPVSESTLPIMLQEKPKTEEENGVKEDENFNGTTVTIIAGIPGSYKESLCDTILYLTQNHIRWTVIKQSLGSTKSFILGELHQTLSRLWNSRKRRLGSSQSSSRILLVTPGFTDIVDVVHAIFNHPDPDVVQHTRIGAVTVCIDPQAAYMNHRLTFPNFVNQCAQGFVNNILFTSATSIQNSSLAEIQTMLRSVNSDVAFFLAEKGSIKRSSDIDAVLSQTAFMEDSKVRARNLLYPGWTEGIRRKITFVLEEKPLKFSQPLVKSQLINKLRELKSQITTYPFSGNVFYVHGSLLFTDSDRMMDLQYFVNSGHLSLNPSKDNRVDSSMPNGDGPHSDKKSCLVFTGNQLVESHLKDWLRTCTKQKPQMKKAITRKDLSKDEVKQIHSQHHLDPLPAGWFYNGTHFVSFDGEKEDLHPCLDDFVREYVENKNKEIEEHNNNVRRNASQFVDLFS